MLFKHRYYKFLFLDAIFEGGRMFVGATSVAYIISCGIPLEKIATLKIIQAMIIIFFEIPTGLFADSVGRRNSLIASVTCGLGGFLSFFLGANWNFFIIGEILTALSLCFWSGAYEAYSIDQSGLEHGKKEIDQFFHLNQTWNSIAVMIFGFIGGLIGTLGLSIPYLAAAISFAFLFSLLCLVFPNDYCKNTKNISLDKNKIIHSCCIHFSAISSHIIKQPKIFYIVVGMITVQFVIQPLLHYWQPFFQELFYSNSAQLGFVFTAYCLTTAFFGFFYTKLVNFYWFRTLSSTIVLFGIFSILYLFFSWQSSFILGILLFCLIQGFLAIARTSLNVRLFEKISKDSRASILSSVSLLSRFGMITSLIFLSLWLHSADKNFLLIPIFGLYATISLIIICSVSILGFLQNFAIKKNQFL